MSSVVASDNPDLLAMVRPLLALDQPDRDRRAMSADAGYFIADDGARIVVRRTEGAVPRVPQQVRGSHRSVAFAVAGMIELMASEPQVHRCVLDLNGSHLEIHRERPGKERADA